MIISAPGGETTGFASWYADLWMQEPLTLRAFHSLLHLRRFLGVAEPETLAALYAESSKDQQGVTDQLGYQVRRAVEMLVQAFDRIDAESDRKLLAGVKEKDLYDSALTIMMRLFRGYKAISGLPRALVTCAITKHLNFAFVSTTHVFNQRVFVFAFSQASALALLQSTFHEVWAREYSSTLETRL